MPQEKFPIEAGDSFGRYTVLAEAPKPLPSSPGRYWLVRCICGTQRVKQSSELRLGRSKSCGCATMEARRRNGRATATHGRSGDPIWFIWSAMRQRCGNTNDRNFENYGGRGIKVCERWQSSFSAFFDDMGNRPAGMSLNRKDNNGPYSPENCEWSTLKAQARNTRRNRFLSLNGISLCMTEWAELFGLKPQMLYQRLSRGMSLSEALK